MAPSIPNIFPDREPKSVDAGGGKIIYEDSGEADRQVILCLPGVGDLRQSYRFLAPKLRLAGYRVLVSEMRASGASPSAGFSSFTPEDSASDAVAVLSQAGISKTTLVCNSFTAASSFYLAGTQPEKVSAVIAFGGIVRDQSADPFFRPITHLLFLRLWGVSAWIGYWKTLFKKSPPADLHAYANTISQYMKQDSGQLTALGKMLRASKNPSYQHVSKITAPVLLIAGDKDPDFSNPKQEMEDVGKALTNSKEVETKIMEGLGHYCHVEVPDQSAECVLEFLKQNSL